MKDGLGSITSLTDNTETVVNTYEYDAFGNVVSQKESVVNPYGYTGRILDSESGLMYYRARYYDPEVGRFITADPKSFGRGLNLYVYVLNNPVNFVDPSGLIRHRFCASGRLHVKIGARGKICFTWDHEGDFGFLICAGGGAGVGAGGRLYYQMLPGDLSEGWSWWGNIVPSAVAQLGPVGAGAGFGFKSIYDAWKYYQACGEMWSAIKKLLEGFRVNAGVFGVAAGASVDAVGCIQYIW